MVSTGLGSPSRKRTEIVTYSVSRKHGSLWIYCLESVQPVGFSVHRADMNEDLSGKKKGRGVCFMIKYSWCDCDNVQKLKSFCSPDLEYLAIIKCRPYYLAREFSSVIVTAGYIPPQADTTTALKELHWTFCKPHILRPHLL